MTRVHRSPIVLTGLTVSAVGMLSRAPIAPAGPASEARVAVGLIAFASAPP